MVTFSTMTLMTVMFFGFGEEELDIEERDVVEEDRGGQKLPEERRQVGRAVQAAGEREVRVELSTFDRARCGAHCEAVRTHMIFFWLFSLLTSLRILLSKVINTLNLSWRVLQRGRPRASKPDQRSKERSCVLCHALK